MTCSEEINQVVEVCRQKLNWSSPIVQGTYADYHSVPICVLHAVFSINTKYAAVLNVMARYTAYLQSLNSGVQTVSQFIATVKDFGVDRFAKEVVQNRQRTSARSGILKAEASLRFAEVLERFGVQQFEDLPKVMHNDEFCRKIRLIPGQKLSVDYFLMMAGRHDLIKADRMILRFLSRCLNDRQVDAVEALHFLAGATAILIVDYPRLTPRLLDNLIWEYESGTVGSNWGK